MYQAHISHRVLATNLLVENDLVQARLHGIGGGWQPVDGVGAPRGPRAARAAHAQRARRARLTAHAAPALRAGPGLAGRLDAAWGREYNMYLQCYFGAASAILIEKHKKLQAL